MTQRYSSIAFTDGGHDTTPDDEDDDSPEDEPGDELPLGSRRVRDEGPKPPAEYRDWDRDAKVTYLQLGHTRADLLALIRGWIGSNRGSDRLNKRELGQIVVDLEAL